MIYIKSQVRTKYLNDDGTYLKPKQYFFKEYIGRMSRYLINQYSSRGKMWDRNMKKPRQIIWIKRKPTGYIYLTGFQFRKAEGHLKLRSCLHDTIIKSAPRIGKYINKNELYSQCTPQIVKATNMNKT